MTKSGFVGILGLPNVGKSTLLNLLLGEKIAIVSKKPQATRRNVTGILSTQDYQVIIVDTPGVHKIEKMMNKIMTDYINKTVKDIDVAVIMVDGRFLSESLIKYIEFLQLHNKALIFFINKIDIMDEQGIREMENKILSTFKPKTVVKGSLTLMPFIKDEILNAIVDSLEEGPFYYTDDIISTETERFIVSEMIREKVMEYVSDEIPYSTAVVIEEFKYRENNYIYIKSNIIVEKASHKGIMIGVNGKMIKQIGTNARLALENFLQKKVFLDIHVKIVKNWTKKENLLKQFIDSSF